MKNGDYWGAALERGADKDYIHVLLSSPDPSESVFEVLTLGLDLAYQRAKGVLGHQLWSEWSLHQLSFTPADGRSDI